MKLNKAYSFDRAFCIMQPPMEKTRLLPPNPSATPRRSRLCFLPFAPSFNWNAFPWFSSYFPRAWSSSLCLRPEAHIAPFSDKDEISHSARLQENKDCAHNNFVSSCPSCLSNRFPALPVDECSLLVSVRASEIYPHLQDTHPLVLLTTTDVNGFPSQCIFSFVREIDSNILYCPFSIRIYVCRKGTTCHNGTFYWENSVAFEEVEEGKHDLEIPMTSATGVFPGPEIMKPVSCTASFESIGQGIRLVSVSVNSKVLTQMSRALTPYDSDRLE